jgi:long-chain acyl-CoA synthetase
VGEAGELIVRGPQVMQGFWNQPGASADQVRGGWLFSGDIATRDEDWYLYIVDRKKDVIIAGGYNVYPREVDEVLHTHPKVRQAVTVGLPDAYRGETVKAFVVLKAGESADEAEIVAFCRERLSAYKAPRLIEFRDSLPTSGVGKVLRRLLREEAPGGGSDAS